MLNFRSFSGLSDGPYVLQFYCWLTQKPRNEKKEDLICIHAGIVYDFHTNDSKKS